MKRIFAACLCTAFSAMVFGASLKLPRVFADHMVLQRNQPVKIWGWADPGKSVTITFADQQLQAQADDSGKFQAQLRPMPAGGPYRMTVTSDTMLVVDDILVGDVWIAGGQSNMEWQLQWEVNNWKEEVKDSNYPQIRFFHVPNDFSETPQKDLTGGEWKVASDSTSPGFSAVAWFFAKHNHLEKGVPVGIVESFWGGTPAEAWTSIETLAHTPGYEDEAKKIIHPEISWEEFRKENDAKEERKWALMRDTAGAMATGAQRVDYDDSKWEKLDLPCNCEMTDLAWMRREVTLPADAKNVELYIDRVVQEAFIFFNGTLVYKKSWNEDEKPIAIADSLLRTGKNVIAYRAANSWDNHVYFGNPNEMWLKVSGKKISLEGNWKYSNMVEPPLPQSIKLFQMPSFLYNAKIVPIGGYTARGVIWYQGENNTGEPQYYHQLFANMIGDWRALWGNDLDFLFVQLANFMERKDQPQENSNWALLREAQTQTLSTPHTGMAVTIDIGNADDIHPKDKQDVGARLWLAARKVSYNEKLVYSGPVYQSIKVRGNEVTVQFGHIGGGLKTSGKLVGFAVAGADKQFHWAMAEINNGKVILSSPEVPHPVAVRYAWADNPEATLYNEENLPAVPFRTDDW